MAAGEHDLQRIDNARFREAFQASGLSLNEVADRMGSDARAVARSLGLVSYHCVKRDKSFDGTFSKITYRSAAKVIRALGYDPVDFDI